MFCSIRLREGDVGVYVRGGGGQAQLARARLGCGGGCGACAGRGGACGGSSAACPERSMYLNCSMCAITSRMHTSAMPFSPAAAYLHLPELRRTCSCVLKRRDERSYLTTALFFEDHSRTRDVPLSRRTFTKRRKTDTKNT